MLTASQALSKASSTAHWAVGMCDNFVANMFGYTSSGYPTAANHWASIPGNDKHPGDMNAPAGALMFWGGGAGHVAISDGSGGIFTTDYPTSGVVSHVSAGVISGQWGKPYLGWSVPVFQGQVGSTSGTATNASSAGFILPGVPNPIPSVTSGIVDSITGAFGISLKDLLQRLALILLGGTLLVIGLIRLTDTGGQVKVLGGKAKGLFESDESEDESEETEEEGETENAVPDKPQRGRNVQSRKHGNRGGESEAHKQETSETASETAAS